MIERNKGKEQKDYDISSVMVEVIVSNTKSLEKVNKNINFYMGLLGELDSKGLSIKRIDLLNKLIDKHLTV